MSHANSIPNDTDIAPPPSAPHLVVMSLDDALDNLDQFRARPAKGFDVLRDHTDLCANPRVAAVFVECCMAVDRLDLAEMALPMADDETGILAAMLMMAKGKPKLALAALKSIPEDARHRIYAFGVRVQANVLTRQYDAASKAVYDWAVAVPSSPQPYRVMGKALADKGDVRAERWFQRAINVSGGGSGPVLDLATLMIKQGRTDEARASLQALKYVTGRTKRRKQRLLKAL